MKIKKMNDFERIVDVINMIYFWLVKGNVFFFFIL